MKLVKFFLVIVAFSQAPLLAQANKNKAASPKQSQGNKLINIKDDSSHMRGLDAKNAYLNEVYFSFNTDLLFYPGETQVRLDSSCKAVRDGDVNQAIRVPANKMLRISSSSVSYFFPIAFKTAQIDGTSVGIECTNHDLKKLLDVANLLESQIKILIAPAYLKVSTSADQNARHYIPVLEAAPAAISDVDRISKARDKVFFSFDKDMVFVAGQTLISFPRCAIYREAANYPAAKIAKGTIFPVEFTYEAIIPKMGSPSLNYVVQLSTVSAKVGSETEAIGIRCLIEDNTISELAKVLRGTATLHLKKTVFKDF